jgi:hypothetical protein
MATLFFVTNPDKLNTALSLCHESDAIVTLNFDAKPQSEPSNISRLSVNGTNRQGAITTMQFIEMCVEYD